MNPDDLNTYIEALEHRFQAYKGQVPGTTLSRVLLDNPICRRWGIPTKPDREARLVWGLALGGMNEAKHTIYGQTIRQTILNAHRHDDRYLIATELATKSCSEVLAYLKKCEDILLVEAIALRDRRVTVYRAADKRIKALEGKVQA